MTEHSYIHNKVTTPLSRKVPLAFRRGVRGEAGAGGEASFKVCVWCNTYNQASYIKDAMDGFCMQQTSFPFACHIMDDASTDGEPEVIKQYLNDHFDTEWTKETDDYHLTVARHQENKNCYFAVYLLKYNHHSIKKRRLRYYREVTDETDYVALCEGDDYWTDEHKLQKQADALDANPQAMLAFTNFRIVDGKGQPLPAGSRPVIEQFARRSHSGDNLPTLLRYGNYIMLLTSMYRYKVFESEYRTNSPVRMDFDTTMAAALMGDFIWMPEQTACYRSLESGMIATALRQGVHWSQDVYRHYAIQVMNGQCKPMSFRHRLNIMILILMRALKKKDKQLLKDTLLIRPLSCLLLPIAFVRLKIKH